MSGIEELYDSNHDAEECEISTTTETLTTVDPVSRLQADSGTYDTPDDVISVQIDTC